MERIYHSWDKWECYKHNFFGSYPKGMKKCDAEKKYQELLSDLPRFNSVLQRVIKEWEYSCEHNLTNTEMNRVAWLGQASMALACAIPSDARGGYNLMTEGQRNRADKLAGAYIAIWEATHES